MYRNTSTEQPESLQRDALISALKKELYDIRDKEHQYIALNDDVHNCQARYSMLKEEKERKENEHRIKNDINRKNIADLRSEVDNLKMQIHKCSVHIEDILRQSAGVKRAIDNRQSQIASIMSGNQDLEAKNQQVDQDNHAVSGKIKTLKEDRNKIDNDNEKLQRQLEQTINSLKSLQKEARFLESSNNKLSSMLVVAERDHSDLISEMRNRDDMVSTTNKKLEQLNRQIEELKDKINKLEKECIRNEQELNSTTENLEHIMANNKEQTKKIKQAQNNLRGVENELDKAILERDGLEIENADFHAQHKILNSQIDNILLQIIQCEKINSEMQKEIEAYIQSDEEARSRLDRKTAMKKMLETVTARLGQTGSHIAHLR